MPQTYMRAVASGVVATTSARAVSCSFSAGPTPGRVGSSGAGQASTTSSLEAGCDTARRHRVLRSLAWSSTSTCPCCHGRTRGSPRPLPRPCSRTGGAPASRAAPAGIWPTWCGTWPRCSTSGSGSCAPAPRTPPATRGPTGGAAPMWHLAEVQPFWEWCARPRAEAPSGSPEPDGRADDELLAFLAASSARLETALDGADPAEPVWTWAPRRDVAFVLRRQAQEAVVHTADVELVLGDLRPVPADVGLDGIDEWLEVFVPSALPEGPPAGAHPVVLHAVDADAERSLFAGTRPFPIATLTGNAGDLLLGLWHRLGMEVLTVDGDPATAAAMLQLVTVE